MALLHTLTISLPDNLYRQLKRVADLARQPAETVIVQSLAHSLPSLVDEIPIQYQPDVYPLLSMSDDELERESQRIFPAERWAEYELLLDKKKAGALTDQ